MAAQVFLIPWSRCMSGQLHDGVVLVDGMLAAKDPVSMAKAEAERQRQQRVAALKQRKAEYLKAVELIDNKLTEMGEERRRLKTRNGNDVEEAFVEAFLNLRGIKPACEAVGISSATVRKFMKEVPEFAARIENAREDITDDIEAGLANDILSGKFNPIERLAWLNANRADRYSRNSKVTVQGEIKHSHSWKDVVQEAQRAKLAALNGGDEEFILDMATPLPRLPDGLDE
jgi:hypothetical protein